MPVSHEPKALRIVKTNRGEAKPQRWLQAAPVAVAETDSGA